jgi:hypothetical protein
MVNVTSSPTRLGTGDPKLSPVETSGGAEWRAAKAAPFIIEDSAADQIIAIRFSLIFIASRPILVS